MATEDKDKGYDRLKRHKGARYSGMKIGRGHKWYYDQGEWRERKVTPDEWNIYYQTTKKRAGKAPEGSGAPVGTEYNWLIVAHQRVDKLDANTYMTRMEGQKFKVAHKRASKNKWSTTEKTQRKQVIEFLEQVITELREAGENDPVPYTTGEEERIYGLEHRNKKELYDMAAEQDIPRRSKMSREDLLDAIKSTLDGQETEEPAPVKGKTPPKLSERPKKDLYQMAGQRDIKGRSEMKKKELVKALKKDMSRQQELA